VPFPETQVREKIVERYIEVPVERIVERIIEVPVYKGLCKHVCMCAYVYVGMCVCVRWGVYNCVMLASVRP